MAYRSVGTAHVHTASLHERPTTELVRDAAHKASLLVAKEIDLARTELQNDMAAEIAMVKRMAVAGIAGIATIDMLLVAAVFALLPYMAGWLAALVVAGVTLVVAIVAGLIGWRLHVARPLARTRKTLVEDVQWMKREIV